MRIILSALLFFHLISFGEIKLEEIKDPLQRDPTGAQFKLTFTKSRQKTPEPRELELKLIEQPDGTLGSGLNSDAPVHDQTKNTARNS